VGTVNALYFRCDPNVDNPSNITFDIDITSITGGDRKDWNNMAAGIFNSPQATAAVVQQFRERLNSPQVLQRLSEIVTKAIQQLLTEEAELASRLLAEITMGSGR
jgi:hypothetical protein